MTATCAVVKAAIWVAENAAQSSVVSLAIVAVDSAAIWAVERLGMMVAMRGAPAMQTVPIETLFGTPSSETSAQ
jgi:hypothetical protein